MVSTAIRIMPLAPELWAQVRAYADNRDAELSVNFTGRSQPVDSAARSLLREVVGAALQSADVASELHHLALDVSFLNDGLHVRVEHDGTYEQSNRAQAEAGVLEFVEPVGRLGGSLSLSSGRGFGLRVEVTLPYENGTQVTDNQSRLITPPPQPRTQLAYGNTPLTLFERLTPQEEATLSLLSIGLSNKEISARMNLSVGTVKYHLAQIYQKLDVQGRGRGAAVARARELGLIFD